MTDLLVALREQFTDTHIYKSDNRKRIYNLVRVCNNLQNHNASEEGVNLPKRARLRAFNHTREQKLIELTT